MSRNYPSVLGQTATEILINLSIHPMTSGGLKRVIATQTVPMHLPRLCERGLIRFTMFTPQRRLYRLTEAGKKEVLKLVAEGQESC